MAVPSLLLLLAWDLLVRQPTRILAWRLLHDDDLAGGWLAALAPRPPGDLDRDPIALALGALAVVAALAYLLAALLGARFPARLTLLGTAAFALLVVPTAALVGLGWATERPFGQDGGVVQLPLAIEKILAGQSPYAADYSDSILGKQSRVSDFWASWGGNPILRHHAYLPGTHLLMMPLHLLSRATGGWFDPRMVTLASALVAAWLASRLVAGEAARLTAAAVVLVNPLVYWHVVWGANDIVLVALLLGAALCAQAGRWTAFGALLGLAAATKQLAWPFIPFLMLHAVGTTSFLGLLRPGRRALGVAGVAAAVFLVVVVPVAALDFRAFWSDIVGYNVGLPGADNYPLGGTPGFGAANFLIYFGAVGSLRDYFPFSVFYAVLIPLGLWLVHVQAKEGGLGTAFLTGTVALVASLYFSRVVHANYLLPAAILLPVGLLAARAVRRADAAILALLLLMGAATIVELTPLGLAWADALAARFPQHAPAIVRGVLPQAAPGLVEDPLSLAWGAAAAGLGLVALAMAVVQGERRFRSELITVGFSLVVAVPLWVLVSLGARTGTVRGQDGWIVEVPASAARIEKWRSPYARPPEERPTAREAWATSFKREPPRLLTPDPPSGPPGSTLPGLPFRNDPRLLAAMAVVVAALLVAFMTGEPWPVGATLLAPPAVFGIVMGGAGREALALPALLLAAWWGADGHPRRAGMAAGLAAALSWIAAAAVPFVLLPVLRSAESRRAALVATATAFAVVALPVAVLDVPAFVRAVLPAGGAPGVGIGNLLLYRGRAFPGGFLVPLLAAAAIGFWLWVRARTGAIPHEGAAAAAVLLVLAAGAGGASPDVLWLPLVLLAVAGARATVTGADPSPR